MQHAFADGLRLALVYGAVEDVYLAWGLAVHELQHGGGRVGAAVVGQNQAEVRVLREKGKKGFLGEPLRFVVAGYDQASLHRGGCFIVGETAKEWCARKDSNFRPSGS